MVTVCWKILHPPWGVRPIRDFRVSAIALATADDFVVQSDWSSSCPSCLFRVLRAHHSARHLAAAFGLRDLAPCAAILAISNRNVRKPSTAGSFLCFRRGFIRGLMGSL